MMCRDAGYVCSGSNSTSIRPDTCEPGTYAVQLTFDQLSKMDIKLLNLVIILACIGEGSTHKTLFSPAQSWSFSVDKGWLGWDMTGTFTGVNYLNMSLGSQSLATATCSKPDQFCCDSTFGKMIGGLRMCGNNCQVRSVFSNLPTHNYIRVKVQLALIDQNQNWIYMFADNELRMRLRKVSWVYPAANSQACLPG